MHENLESVGELEKQTEKTRTKEEQANKASTALQSCHRIILRVCHCHRPEPHLGAGTGHDFSHEYHCQGPWATNVATAATSPGLCVYITGFILEKRLKLTEPTLRWRHQDSDRGHSQLQFPFQEDQLATLHSQDTTVKIPKPGDEAEVLLWTTETENDHIRRVRGEVSH